MRWPYYEHDLLLRYQLNKKEKIMKKVLGIEQEDLDQLVIDMILPEFKNMKAIIDISQTDGLVMNWHWQPSWFGTEYIRMASVSWHLLNRLGDDKLEYCKNLIRLTNSIISPKQTDAIS
jgi:hypothetical protein